ncbi:unnamed protein product [Moneuplotes crassus]|uniref:Homologous-pairing protein 2 homolog n=1 Tax=Euplotes crassus TaxID=5936 RepID=A0AAD1UHW3_EUPCR|nr:unnamed protein product [Moneuplotes crassus]
MSDSEHNQIEISEDGSEEVKEVNLEEVKRKEKTKKIKAKKGKKTKTASRRSSKSRSRRSSTRKSREPSVRKSKKSEIQPDSQDPDFSVNIDEDEDEQSLELDGEAFDDLEEEFEGEKKTKKATKKSKKATKVPKSKEADKKKSKLDQPKKKKREKKMMNDVEAKEAISKYMEAQNRPYSIQNIIDNLRGEIRKAQTQKILDALTEENILTCKEYGKAKIYLINQDIFPETTNEDLEKLDKEIDTKKKEFEELDAKLKSLNSDLRKIKIEPTNAELDAELEALTSENLRLEGRLEEYGDVQEDRSISIDDIEKQEKLFSKEWRVRKKGFMEIIDTISEALEKKPKELMEEIGIETDEDYNVVCPKK